VKPGFHELWPTYVEVVDFGQELATALSADLINIAQVRLGSGDILDGRTEAVTKMREQVIEAFQCHLDAYGETLTENFKLKSWLNIGSLEAHNHSGAQFSAVFYLMGHDGDLVLHDPRTNANRGYNSDALKKHFEPVRFTPRAGLGVIFPSYLYHSVARSREFRLALAVDLYLGDD